MNKVYFQLPNLHRLLLGLFLVIAVGSNGLLIAANSAAESDTEPRVIRIELGPDLTPHRLNKISKWPHERAHHGDFAP